MKGSRVRTVVEELSGEKIDIVRWSDNPVEFCGNALNPADILDITVDEASQVILVVVPHDQLSLAIGKRGQNARLASRLIGWNIDIRSDLELRGEVPEEGAAEGAAGESEVLQAEQEDTDGAAAADDASASPDTETPPRQEHEDTTGTGT